MNLPSWLPLLFVVLATPRATRFVTRDKLPLIAVPREWFINRWGVYEDDPRDDLNTRRERRRVSIGGRKTNLPMASLAYLWECDWCVSIWVGGLLTYLTWLRPVELTYVMVAIVASYAAGWNANAESKTK